MKSKFKDIRKPQKIHCNKFIFICRNSHLEPSTMTWKWMDEDSSGDRIVKPFKNLFIAEGEGIFDFMQTCVLKFCVKLCQIDAHKTSIYRTGTGDYICVSEDNDLDQSAQMTELLMPWLKQAEQTFVVPFKSAYTYNTQQEFDKSTNFIRTIGNNLENENEFAPMEDGNILCGGITTGGIIIHTNVI